MYSYIDISNSYSVQYIMYQFIMIRQLNLDITLIYTHRNICCIQCITSRDGTPD